MGTAFAYPVTPVSPTKSLGSTFLALIARELQTSAQSSASDHVGVIMADLRYWPDLTPGLRRTVMNDITSRLRGALPARVHIGRDGYRIKIVASGSVLDLAAYADRARLCLRRLRRMVGTAAFEFDLALAVAAAGESAEELTSRAQAMLSPL